MKDHIVLLSKSLSRDLLGFVVSLEQGRVGLLLVCPRFQITNPERISSF